MKKTIIVFCSLLLSGSLMNVNAQNRIRANEYLINILINDDKIEIVADIQLVARKGKGETFLLFNKCAQISSFKIDNRDVPYDLQNDTLRFSVENKEAHLRLTYNLPVAITFDTVNADECRQLPSSKQHY
jgi:hypothetical protein